MSVSAAGGVTGAVAADAGPLTGDAILKAFADPEGLKKFAAQAGDMIAAATARSHVLIAAAQSDRDAAQAELDAARAEREQIVTEARAKADALAAEARARCDAARDEVAAAQQTLAGIEAEGKALAAKNAGLKAEIEAAFAQRAAALDARERDLMEREATAAALAEKAALAAAAADAARTDYNRRVDAMRAIMLEN